MKRLALKTINDALATRGHAERLVKGRGYWYFTEGDAPNWPSSAVYVYSLTDLTLDQWLNERDELAETARRHRRTNERKEDVQMTQLEKLRADFDEVRGFLDHLRVRAVKLHTEKPSDGLDRADVICQGLDNGLEILLAGLDGEINAEKTKAA